MGHDTWLGPTITAVVTAIAMALLSRKNTRAPEVVAGHSRLRLPKVFLVMGWVSLIMAALALAGLVHFVPNEWPVAVIIALCAAGFGYMGLMLVRDGRYHQAAFDAETLIVIDGRQRLESCRWSDLVSARVHPLSKMIVLRTRDARKLKINPYLIGSDALFHTMAVNTALPVAELVAKARATA